MKLLVCDPEGSRSRGGLSIALDRLMQGLQSPGWQLWRLERHVGSYSASQLGQPNQEAPALELVIQRIQPDLVVAVGWHTWSEQAVVAACRQGIPTVFWSHGVGCLTWYAARPVLGALRWCLRAPRMLSVIATLTWVNQLVVAYARTNARDARSVDEGLARCWLGNPIRVIGNPVDTGFWKPEHPPQGDSAVVVSVGRLEWQKGHAAALRIVMATRAKHLRLSCMVPTLNPYGKQMQRQASHSGQADRLKLSIGLTDEQRRQQLQQALCLISWSETEYQSLAMLEALACGCPVIARPRGWLRHGPIPGVLIARNQGEASSWLDALAADAAWAHRLGQEGRAYVERHHAIAVVSQQWKELIHSMLQPR